ncbi:uncharacterized protein LOC110818406, partial [Carica papaya]|uniref:uncharacterized protein LOC110818406 n=1 Tax=Carica papaya TaxID=3649 RepID=UPI000B8C872B
MQYIYSDALEVQLPRILPNGHGPYSVFPAVLIGLFGVGAVERAYADAEEAAAKPPLSSESPTNYADLEEIAKKERQRIEELLKSKGIQHGSYPRFTVAVKGQKLLRPYESPDFKEIEDTILMALHSPEVYDDIARGTR